MGPSKRRHGAIPIRRKNPGVEQSVSAVGPICAPDLCPWGRKAFLGYLGDDEEQWQEYDSCALIRKQPSDALLFVDQRSEEHTSELQSLMRISYAVFCLKKKNRIT